MLERDKVLSGLQLSPMEAAFILRYLLKTGEDATISEYAAWVIWIGDLLRRLPHLSLIQMQRLLETMLPDLEVFAAKANWPRESFPLVFGDGDYATWPGRGWYVLATGAFCPQRGGCFETLGYNLTELYRRRVRFCKDASSAPQIFTGSLAKS